MLVDNTKARKRLKSTKKYIDALQDKYSKLCLIREDLSFKKPFSDEITLDESNKYFNKMQNNKRGKPTIFGNLVGSVCLKEYTEDKGVHIHSLLILDGNKVQKDAHMGDMIGEYWEKITEGKGSYHNCNRNKYKHTGIGMLDYSDTEKRKLLDEHVLPYLCKDDPEQELEAVKSNKKDRAFTRGIMPKSKGNMGRPRKESKK